MSANSTLETSVTITETVDDMRRYVAAQRREGASIGLVPTMGALHAGHLSLVDRARTECDRVVVSMFVNPTQFGPHEDYAQYPRPFEADVNACERAGVDAIFHPLAELMYPPSFATSVSVDSVTKLWEGAHRPGHFQGVATVVLKLLNIIEPDIAYFGRKDYQQQLVIRRMCDDLNLDVEIRTCPTIREPDGLALSSRNCYLSAAERDSALQLSRCLQWARERLISGETNLTDLRTAMSTHLEQTPHVVVDYFVIADPDTLEELAAPQKHMVALVAARVGKTRLIDNVPIELP